MSLEPMPLFWLALTLLAYLGSRWLYRRSGRYVLSPLILVPALLLAVAVPLHTAYAEYARNTHWLMAVLGPVTVAFAVPIWQQRALLARHWPALMMGMLAGSTASIASSWGLAHLLALDNATSLSLVPRSITTLRWLPLRTALARGALFGVGAHGAGVSRAQEVGREEGSVAGLVMVLTGLLNLFAAPLLAMLL